MRHARRTRWLKLAAVVALGTAFQAAGCARYFAEFSVQAVDVCSVVNCTGSTFFNFCEPFILFVDCPNLLTDTNP